jgi:hypothetical protein
MAKPSAIPNRLSLNASHYQSESSSIVEESNDFQKSDKNKVNTDHLAPLDKPSIESFIESLKNSGDAYSYLSNHLKQTAEGLHKAFEELEKLRAEHENYVSINKAVDGNDDDFDGRIQLCEDRIQELVDFIEDSISKFSDLNNLTETPQSTRHFFNNSISTLNPTYPSPDIRRAEFDDSIEVSYSSDEDVSEIIEDKKLGSSFANYINDHVISEETKQHQVKFEMHNKVHQENAKANIVEKTFYNTLAGAVGYLAAFGIGNLAAKLTPAVGPLMLPILAAPLHTLLAGPLSGMIRSTTWVNPATKEQIMHQRARARAQGDTHRKAVGLESKIKFTWHGEHLTAEEILKKDPNFNNWYSKVITDDNPFYSFLCTYLLRNFIIEILRPPLDQPDFSSIPTVPDYHPQEFFSTHTALGFAADLGLQTLAGTLAGAMTMIINQAIRAHIKDFHSFEVVTKTRAVWNLERIYLTSCKADFEAAIENEADLELKNLLDKECHKISLQLDKAEKKSSFLSSYLYEVSLLWQEKKRGIAGDPDQPGTRLDTIFDITGKFISLLPVAITSYLVSAYAPIRAPNRTEAWFQMYGRALAPPIALMGFLLRTEISGYVRLVYGDVKGRVSAHTRSTATEMPNELSPKQSPTQTPIMGYADSSDSIV